MYKPSKIFNDGNVDIEVSFPACSNEESANTVANHYSSLFFDPANFNMYVIDNEGNRVSVNNDDAVCKVCTKELGPSIDCSTKEGRSKAAETLLKANDAYMIDESDMKVIPLLEIAELVRERVNDNGLVKFDGIAYGINKISAANM